MKKIHGIATIVIACAGLLSGCAPQTVLEQFPPPDPIHGTGEVCGVATNAPPTIISSSRAESTNPVLRSDGEQFAIAYTSLGGPVARIRLMQVDKKGAVTSEGTLLESKGKSREPSLSADSAEVHLTWLDGTSVKSARVGKNEKTPATFGLNARYATSGPYGAVAWVDSGTLMFRCDGMLPAPNLRGVRREPDPILIARGGIETIDMAWTGKFFAITWSVAIKGGRQIMMQRVLNNGRLMGPPVKVSGVSGISKNPVIAWTGWEFGVAWTTAFAADDNDDNKFRIFFAVVPEKGAVPTSTKQLNFSGSADQVALASSGSEFVLSWVGSHPTGSAIFFQRLEKNSTPIGDTLKLNDDTPAACGRPSLVFAGDGYGVAWHDSRDDEASNIVFTYVSCSSSPVAAPDAPAPSSDTDAPASTDSAPAGEELKDVF